MFSMAIKDLYYSYVLPSKASLLTAIFAIFGGSCSGLASGPAAGWVDGVGIAWSDIQ